MCGIFGFISTAGEGPSIPRLRNLALVTQSRGMHAFGLAWAGRDGSIGTWKSPGAAHTHLDELEACRTAVAMIGHCRFATHGHPEENSNNHPHAAHKGGVFVHNGVIRNDRELVDEFDLAPETSCDSEVFGMLLRQERGSPLDRAMMATSLIEGNLAILGLWANPVRLLVARRGNPLHWGEGGRGLYFASLPKGLPGEIHETRDGEHTLITRRKNGCLKTAARMP